MRSAGWRTLPRTASGMAGVPGGSLPLIGLILVQFGVPAGGIALVIGVDRLLDMFRTAVNVTGDLAVTTVMAVAEGETLSLLDDAADTADPNKGFENRLEQEPEALEPDKGRCNVNLPRAAVQEADPDAEDPALWWWWW